MNDPLERRRVGFVLAVALVAVSSAAVLVRAVDGPPLAVAFWRTALVALLLAPGVRRVSGADAVRIAVAGLCLAAHFAVWFASLEHTSVLRSTVLVCLSPIWAALLEWGGQGQRPARGYWSGLALALPGVALLGATGAEQGKLLGDALALVGGQLAAAYFVLGRSVRQRVGIGTYGSLVCAAAAAGLLPAAALAGTPMLAFDPKGWALIAALAVGPQLLGHNGFNYALRWLPASTVATVVLLEPVGATLLALVVLGEVPGPWSVVGGALAVAGVVRATR